MKVRPKDFTQFRSIVPCSVHRPASAPRILLTVSVAIIIAGWIGLPVKADVPMSEYITVFFEQDGRPYDKPVTFRISWRLAIAIPDRYFQNLRRAVSYRNVPHPVDRSSDAVRHGSFCLWTATIGTVRLSIAGVLASCLTLPYVWFIAPVIFGGVYTVIVGEILVFLVEAGVYVLVLQVSIRRALLVSFHQQLAGANGDRWVDSKTT